VVVEVETIAAEDARAGADTTLVMATGTVAAGGVAETDIAKAGAGAELAAKEKVEWT